MTDASPPSPRPPIPSDGFGSIEPAGPASGTDAAAALPNPPSAISPAAPASADFPAAPPAVPAAPAKSSFSATPRRRWVLRISALLATAITAVFVSRHLVITGTLIGFRDLTVTALDTMRDAGLLGILGFIAIYTAGAVLLVPAWILSFSAGMAFGPIVGAISAALGATTGASAAFGLARFWLRGPIERTLLAHHPKLRAIDKAMGKRGWRIVMLCRLSPVMPYNVLNYAFGAGPIRYREFAVATLIGIAPGAFLWSLAGTTGRSLFDVLEGRVAAMDVPPWALALGIIATVVLTVYLAWIARNALKQALREEPTPHVAPPQPS